MSLNNIDLKKYYLENFANLLNGIPSANGEMDVNSVFEKAKSENTSNYSFNSNSVFDGLDSDGNRTISDKELYSFSQLSGNKKTGIEDELKSLFNELNKDSNDTLSKEEFDNMGNTDLKGLGEDLVKKLMVMAGLKIDKEAKEPVQKEIDKLEEKYGTKPEENTVNETTPVTENGNVNSSGGGGGGGGSTIDAGTKDVGTPKTKEEFQQAISSKEAEKQEAEKQAKADIKSQEDAIQEAMKDAESGLTPSQIQEYNQEKEKLDTAIQSQETIINDSTVAIQDKTAQQAANEDSISAYEGQISSLQSSLSSCGDDEEGAAKKARIQQKISNLQAKVAEKKKEQETLKSEIQAAQTALETAKGEKERLETEKDGLLDKFLEENKHKMPPEIQQRIKDAQAEIRKIRAAESTKTDAINSELQTLKTGLAKVEEKENSDKVISENSEDLFDENGKRIGNRKMPTTIEEYAKYGLTGEEIEKFKQCNPQAQAAILDLLDYAIEQGHEVNITSSFRSIEQQKWIYKGGSNPLAAAPGKSQHNKGLAFDIQLNGSNRNKSLKDLGEKWKSWGFTWGGDWKNQYEPWHFDCRGVFT